MTHNLSGPVHLIVEWPKEATHARITWHSENRPMTRYGG